MPPAAQDLRAEVAARQRSIFSPDAGSRALTVHERQRRLRWAGALEMPGSAHTRAQCVVADYTTAQGLGLWSTRRPWCLLNCLWAVRHCPLHFTVNVLMQYLRHSPSRVARSVLSERLESQRAEHCADSGDRIAANASAARGGIGQEGRGHEAAADAVLQGGVFGAGGAGGGFLPEAEDMVGQARNMGQLPGQGPYKRQRG